MKRKREQSTKKKKKKKKVKAAQLEEKLEQSLVGAVLTTPVRDSQLALQTVGRPWTVSIALPGSIIANCQTSELKSYVAGQIARAATVFKVDEVVIFTEDGSEPRQEFRGAKKSDPNLFLARVLQYLETPQYLRKLLFPIHRDLKHAGLINPLDAPHHLRWNQVCRFREGVVEEVLPNGCTVNVGWRKPVKVDRQFKLHTRVTVDFDEAYSGGQVQDGTVVAPSVPREEHGLYWGYETRLATGIEQALKNCPYSGGYDLCVGTSERGHIAQNTEFTL